MSNEISTPGNVQTLADGGHFVTSTDAEVSDIKRLPVSDVAAAVALATTALQPADTTSIISEDPEGYVRVAAYAAYFSDLEATIAAMQAQIDDLIEAGGGTVFAPSLNFSDARNSQYVPAVAF